MACIIPVDVFDKLFVLFCRSPSYRDALRELDPVMFDRFNAVTITPIQRKGRKR